MRGMRIAGFVIAAVVAVVFVIDKIATWATAAPIMRLYRKWMPLVDQSYDYIKEELED